MLGVFASAAAEKAAELAKINELKKGKSQEQKRVIDFFFSQEKDGCLSKNSSNYTMEEYQRLVLDKCKALNIKEKAMNKIGLDYSQIQEIPPVFLSAYRFDDDCVVKIANGQAVSNQYSVSLIFFSATQIYTYQYIFDMMSDNTWEFTKDFFYSDITCFSTSKMVKEKIDITISKGCLKKGAENITKNNYVVDVLEIIVPGATYSFSKRDSETVEQSIQAAKAMIREKKHSV